MKSVCRACLGAALLEVLAFGQTQLPVGSPGNLSSVLYTGPRSKVALPQGAGAKNGLTGMVRVAIKLSDPPLVVAVGANAKQTGILMTAAQQQAYVAGLKQKQDAVMAQVSSAGGVELGRVSKGHNALMVSINASQLGTLRAINGVVAVRPVADYTVSLEDGTLPYIGATAVQNTGVTGAGIRVAMLDTGIDYTHYNLGGSGQVVLE